MTEIKNYFKLDGENPLDRIVEDGGFTGIFRTIACIGDSLSSGEFEATNEDGSVRRYYDYFEYSWGQYIARATGCHVYNFSRGGMTAKEYCNSFAENKGFWDRDKLAQAYIIALGVNDIINQNQDIGSVEDINLEDYNKNANTFCGYYAKIIQRLKAEQPQARFFLMTMPRSFEKEPKKAAHAQLLYNMAELFDYTYVLDFYKYAPIYDSEFRKNFYLGGHLNAAGYLLTAKMVMSYIDYIIRQDQEAFAQVGFIGKDVHNYTAKW